MIVLTVKKQNLAKIINEVVRSIKNGGIIACPTDTVYGLICDAANKKAVKKLYKIKKRPKNKLFPVFVEDIKMAKKFVKVSSEQEKFLKKVWPGAVTAILKSKNKKGTIGIRIPNHKWLLGVAEQLNRPLAETSANLSGEPATTKIKEVLKYFKGRQYQPDLILDGGNLKPAKPSQVIDLTGSRPVILRK